ncbi:response regulator [Daejeonella oryzae]|uniref:response regulator n=1 Tax=Daejeonella oryzae TaxID=1122943 RepID=UPI00040C7ED9|nr:response regulator [Daejeonella oryzae]
MQFASTAQDMEIKQKILIIDDSQIDLPVSALLLKNRLNTADIHLANSGANGLSWLVEHQDELEKGLIILLDVRMPDMDGFGFLNEYDNLPEKIKEKTRIIMLSSTLDPYDIQKANHNPYVETVLNKPLPVNDLIGLLKDMQ